MYTNLVCQKCGSNEGWMFTGNPIYKEVKEDRWYWRWLGDTKLEMFFKVIICEQCIVDKVLGD